MPDAEAAKDLVERALDLGEGPCAGVLDCGGVEAVDGDHEERRDGALFCPDKNGIETKFYGCPDAEETEQAGTQAIEEDDAMKTTFVFDKLPQSLTELEALPEAALTTPYQAAALTVAAAALFALLRG